MKFSNKFKYEIKWAKFKQYELAKKIEAHPSALSMWLRDVHVPKQGDRRLRSLANILNFNEAEIYENQAKYEL